MINPLKLTNHKRDLVELQEFLLYSIFSGGKPSWNVAEATNNMLGGLDDKYPPFSWLYLQWKLEYLFDALGDFGVPNPTRAYEAIVNLLWAKPNLEEVTIRDLEKIGGITPRMARFFFKHCAPGYEDLIILDSFSAGLLVASGLLAEDPDLNDPVEYQEATEMLMTGLLHEKGVRYLDCEFAFFMMKEMKTKYKGEYAKR